MKITIRQVLSDASEMLAGRNLETARLDATLLLGHALGLKRENILLNQEKIITNEEVNTYNELIERRAQHEPVAYIIGKKEFWSLDFIVSRDTLIPRPDSETLVAAALVTAKKITDNSARPLTLRNIEILDIGVGTGCLLITLLKELPSAQGLGVDISEPALNVAEENAKIHGVSDRIRFKKSNWHNEINAKFDLIISNPPYIAENDLVSLMKDVTDYEPKKALTSGVDGMDSYRAIAVNIKDKLNKGGYVLLEVGKGQADAVAEIFEKAGLVIEEIKSDLAGVPRCVIAKN